MQRGELWHPFLVNGNLGVIISLGCAYVSDRAYISTS